MITFVSKSMLTGREHSMEIPMTPDEFKECYKKWQDGSLIQDAFPMLDFGEREFIKTGITPDEWESLMNQGFDM